MALTYPLDLLADFPGWTTSFELMSRDEYSRSAGGVTYAKNLGSPLWRLAAQSRSLRANELDAWRARLDALENGLKLFRGYSMSRCYPIAYPKSGWPTGGAFDGVSAGVSSVGLNNISLRVDGLPAGFAFSVGDLLQITTATGRKDVHRVVEAATADGGGETGVFEVRPALWQGVAVGNLVSVKRPWVPMMIVPGTISTQAEMATGRGTVSFEAVEAR